MGFFYPFKIASNSVEGKSVVTPFTDADNAKLGNLSNPTPVAVTTTGNMAVNTAEYITPPEDINRTLPAPSAGAWVYVKKLDSPPTYTVTFLPHGSEKVDGGASVAFYANESGIFVSDGTDWFLF